MPLILHSKGEIQSAWRKYPDSDFELLIKPLSGVDSENFDKRNMHNEWDKGNPLPVKNEDYDVQRAKLIVKDWKALDDENGDKMACNEKNIELLHNQFPRIITWALREETKLQEGDAAITVGEKKIS